MPATSGATQSICSLENKIVEKGVRTDVVDSVSGGFAENKSGEASELESLKRNVGKDFPEVQDTPAADCCNREDGSLARDDDTQNFPAVRDDKLETGGKPITEEDQLPHPRHDDCEGEFPSTLNTCPMQANSSSSLVAALKSSHSIAGARINRGWSNETGNLSRMDPEVAARAYRKTEKFRKEVAEEYRRLQQGSSMKLVLNQRRPAISDFSWGMWLRCFFRFILDSLVGDLITSNPWKTVSNVFLLPTTLIICFLADVLFMVAIIFYLMVYATTHTISYIVWVMCRVFVLCWHFLRLSAFTTGVAEIIFVYISDIRSAYKADRFKMT